MSLRAGQRESGYLAASASVSRIVRGRSRCHGSAELAKIRSVSEWKSATALAALAALAISILAVVFSFLLAVFLFPPTLFLSLSLSLSLFFFFAYRMFEHMYKRPLVHAECLPSIPLAALRPR